MQAAGIAEENPVKLGLTAVKIGITGFILPFAFALNPDYITFHFDIQTLMTWLSGLVVAYSLLSHSRDMWRRRLHWWNGQFIWELSVW